MWMGLYQETVMILRILLAGICGFIIGMERKKRSKEAGIRTHFVVALGASLMVLISKYGFAESDSARVAAQVVSGIGFLGAGMIFYRRDALYGLTTAAGVWVTAGIGMAAGAGLYILSVSATLILILSQMIFHLPLKIFKVRQKMTVTIKFEAIPGALEIIRELFGFSHFLKSRVNNEQGKLIYTSEFLSNKEINEGLIFEIIQANSFIFSVEF